MLDNKTYIRLMNIHYVIYTSFNVIKHSGSADQHRFIFDPGDCDPEQQFQLHKVQPRAVQEYCNKRLS